MANTLTSLAADIYKAADIVGRELVGFIPSVTINSDAVQRVALNDTVRSFFTRKPTLNTTYTPSMTIPEGDDQTVDNKTMTVGQVANVKIPWTGEDIKHVDNGSGFKTVYGDQIAQAMRAITNSIEGFVAQTAYQGASRAIGTAGTTPFASDFGLVADVRKILVDNGTPQDGDWSIVMDTTAGANLRKLSTLFKANESGNDTMLRQGTLLDLQGFKLRESAGTKVVTKGTGASYTTDTAGYAVGATVITLITGTGTVLAGDVVTFAGDTNKYVVNVGTAAAGPITLAAPGLKVAIATSATAMTIGANFTANVGLHRAAVELAVRAPAMPPGGDAAVDTMIVQDPRSGLVYDMRLYKGYGKQMLDITSFYGAKAWKPDFIGTLLG